MIAALIIKAVNILPVTISLHWIQVKTGNADLGRVFNDGPINKEACDTALTRLRFGLFQKKK